MIGRILIILILFLPAILLALLLHVYLRDRRLRKHLNRKVLFSEDRAEQGMQTSPQKMISRLLTGVPMQKTTYAPGTRIRFDLEALKRIGEKKDGKFVIPEFAERMLQVYLQVFPQWEHIDHIDGWPTCSVALWEKIATTICAKKSLREVQLSFWQNKGFSCDTDNALNLKNDEVSLDGVTLYMKENKTDD